ncbi:DUF2732 family protein [Lonsdalea quercina]|uniref:DUF2732 family protein n=1 Tax=Lonsdalea quercina TaxID=71657 RepID=UPI003975A0D8
MRNIEIRKMKTCAGGIPDLLTKTRLDERANQHFSMSVRLEALAIHIQQQGMDIHQAIDLLRKEATRFEHSAQELR